GLHHAEPQEDTVSQASSLRTQACSSAPRHLKLSTTQLGAASSSSRFPPSLGASTPPPSCAAVVPPSVPESISASSRTPPSVSASFDVQSSAQAETAENASAAYVQRTQREAVLMSPLVMRRLRLVKP